MGIDTEFIFKIRKAENGDIDSLCEVIDRYAVMEDWDKAIEYFERLVEFEPKLVEERFVEITGDEVTYPFILEIIGKRHYVNGNEEMTYKWNQKYLDYHRYLNTISSEQIHIPSLHLYKYLESVDQLDKAENKFLLRWEIELLNTNDTAAR